MSKYFEIFKPDQRTLAMAKQYARLLETLHDNPTPPDPTMILKRRSAVTMN